MLIYLNDFYTPPRGERGLLLGQLAIHVGYKQMSLEVFEVCSSKSFADFPLPTCRGPYYAYPSERAFAPIGCLSSSALFSAVASRFGPKGLVFGGFLGLRNFL